MVICDKEVKVVVDYLRMWCYKVIPLVYDDSLSYYENLCKVVEYLNQVVAQQQVFGKDLEQLQSAIKQLQEWIDNFDTSFIKEEIEKYIATMIFVEINNEGYIIYNIPEKWEDITFNTTGLDINIPGYDYGNLVLSY